MAMSSFKEKVGDLSVVPACLLGAIERIVYSAVRTNVKSLKS